MNSQNFNLYNSPGSVDTITINPGKSGKVLLTFGGDVQTVHRFLTEKSEYFQSHMSDREGRSQYMISSGNSLTDIYAYNDSLTAVNQDYIQQFKDDLPEWYVAFEKKRLEYLNAWYKMNAVLYRTKTLKIEVIPEEDMLQAPYQSLALEDREMLGNRDYMSFLSQYISYNIDLRPAVSKV